ncbi:MAG: L-histidine N(alpha)-methyltransferase [Limisphaerales bacterium]
MSSVISVAIHSSQFTENVRRDLLKSLRRRQVNHKFLYDSFKQTQKWLALHEAFSPARTDKNCADTYEKSFAAAIKRITTPKIHLIGLGCGGGQKDVRLLRLLKEQGEEVSYSPCDVSTAMVLTAQQTVAKIVTNKKCLPFVFDLATAKDLPEIFEQQIPKDATRLITFFGMIPNFEPQIILPKLAALLRPKDFLLFSANLAPGKNYQKGVKKILPLYDNTLTRDWLLTFLFDLGVERDDGKLKFGIENCPAKTGLKRVAAYFHFKKTCCIKIDEEEIKFQSGESIRLFFSYRYTPEKTRMILAEHNLLTLDEWITDSGEEGVFICRPAR